MTTLNEIIHQPVRLQIMAMLAMLPPMMQVTVNDLKDTFDLTDGNLGTHLHKLEEAGYIKITRTFVGNKPQTYVEITEEGRQAFVKYSTTLKNILKSGQQIGAKMPGK